MINVECVICGKEIKITPSRVSKSKTGLFTCSVECMGISSSNKKDYNAECYICKKKMKVKPFRLKSMKAPERITCSKKCYSEDQKERCLGQGNHQYGLKGELNSSYISDVHISDYGYVTCNIPSHPLNTKRGILIHRLVYEEYLIETGQYDELELYDNRYILRRDLVIHHINENKLDNRLENLQSMSHEEHMVIHGKNNILSRNRDELGRLLPIKGKINKGSLYKKHFYDAGYDIFSSEKVEISSGCSRVISTELFIDIPKGFVGLLWSRSGLSVRYNIEVGAGCIDSGYSGEIKVHLYNHGVEDYLVNKGDRIAQLIIMKVELDVFDEAEIENNVRLENGFGSSGV